MLIDCDGCEVRGLACGDCVVTVLLATPALRTGATDQPHRPGELLTDPDHELRLDQAECDAIGVLADSGLVPPLRMLRRVAG